jgi:hypothetical protein
LAYVTGLVDQKLLLQNESLVAENRILRAHLPSRVPLSDPERSTFAEIGKRLGRTGLQQVTCVAKPDTILAWYRRLIARKFDGAKFRKPGRPPIAPAIEALNAALPERTPVGDTTASSRALANLGHPVSDQRVGNILRRYGIQPAPEVLTWRGFATYYVLLFIHLESRRVSLVGSTKHPTSEWMVQMARNATDEGSGLLHGLRYLLHDRDTE